jgi:hypothetical protein
MNAIPRMKEARAAADEAQMRDVLAALHLQFGGQKFSLGEAAAVLRGYSPRRIRELLIDGEMRSYGGRRVVRFSPSDNHARDKFRVIKPTTVVTLVARDGAMKARQAKTMFFSPEKDVASGLPISALRNRTPVASAPPKGTEP